MLEFLIILFTALFFSSVLTVILTIATLLWYLAIIWLCVVIMQIIWRFIQRVIS